MTSLSKVRFGEICRTIEERAGQRNDLPLLSVTKDKGVCLQSETGRRQLGMPNMSVYKVVRRGEFVLAPMALYYGAIGRLSDTAIGVVSPAYDVFSVSERVDPAFFESLLRSPGLIAKYNALSVGGNRNGKRKTTTFEDFCTIEWPLPSLSEQRKVGSALGAIDAAIRAEANSVRGRQLAKRSVMREVLTRGAPLRRHGFKPRPGSWPIGRVSGDLLEIPVSWDLVPLLSVSRLESGHTPSRQRPEYWNGGIHWLSLNDTDEIKKLTVQRTEETISDLGIQNSSARLLPADTVVLTRTAVRGLASRLGVPMATSQDLVAFVCGERIRPRYLVQLLRHMQPEWRRLEAGTSPTNKTIYFADFESMKILLPDVEEQEEISAIGEAFDRLIEAESEAQSRLVALRRATAQGLFAGRLRMPAEATSP